MYLPNTHADTSKNNPRKPPIEKPYDGRRYRADAVKALLTVPDGDDLTMFNVYNESAGQKLALLQSADEVNTRRSSQHRRSLVTKMEAGNSTGDLPLVELLSDLISEPPRTLHVVAPLPPPLTMSTSASFKSTGTRKNLPSGLRRLTNEAIPVLRLAKESVAGSGILGPEVALGGVLAVAEMIQDMQSNKNDLAKLKLHLEELIKTDMSGCDGELKKRLTELALINLDSSKLEPFLVKCDSLAAESGIKRIMRCKKYKEQIQSLRDDIASNIQEFTFYASVSIEKLVKDLVNTVEHVKKTVDEAKAGFKEVEGTVNGTKTPHYRGIDSQIVNNHFYGGKGGSGGGGGIQGHGGAGGAGEGPTLQIAYTAGTLTVNNLPAGPAVVHAAQKAGFKELKGTADETKGQRMYSILILRAIS
ncbi:hypothetical protein K438DRAFT_1763867 [Mycena galopus ATCC 62051]|nr:hypothetical protein K438DRAFT_1763867 [Mycena galopus ATCC 62051]